MASATEPGDAMFDFFAFEFAFVALVRMTRARDQVVTSELADAAAAEFARVAFVHFQNHLDTNYTNCHELGLSRRSGRFEAEELLGGRGRDGGLVFDADDGC